MSSTTDYLVMPTSRPQQASADALVTGLATIAAAEDVTSVLRLGADLLRRLPGITAVTPVALDNRVVVMDDLYEVLQAARRLLTDPQPLGAKPGQLRALPGHPASVVIPLLRDREPFAGILVVAKNVMALNAQRRAIGVVAIALHQAIDRVQMQAKLERAVTTGRLIRVVEGERKAIGRALHDGPAQDLAAVGMMLDSLALAHGENREEILQARRIVDDAVSRVREAVGDLRRSKPPATSVTGPLRELSRDCAPSGVSVSLELEGCRALRVDSETERALTGIVREALRNVERHAQARNVLIEARRERDRLIVAVIDDGVGIQRPAAAGHFGLIQIRELAAEVGGSAEIGSGPQGGTIVRAWFPLSAKPARIDRPQSFAGD